MQNNNQLIELITREVLQKLYNNTVSNNQVADSIIQQPSIGEKQSNSVSEKEIENIKPEQLARYIDHTLLKPDALESDIIKICKEALEYNFASVCVNPSWVETAYNLLKNSQVKVCTVIGFPLGATYPSIKAIEAREAIERGAGEIDMVLNIGYLKSKKYNEVYEDIKEVKKACGNTLLKVILETCLLDSDEKIRACELSKKAGADFVKTSTGFSVSGATAEDVALMRRIVGDSLGVKASGGVRDYDGAIKMIKAGANRLGASASVAILKGQYVHTGY